MALTLTRRRIAPMDQEFERRPLPPDDHYHIEGETIDESPSIGARVAHFLQILLIIAMAILSVAIVWVLGLIFNIW